jgi:competence protein ComEC
MLIDAGPKRESYDAGEKLVLPKLQSLGVHHVDLILLSHPDMDHVGGAGAVLRQFPSAKVVMSAVFEQEPKMLKTIQSWGKDEKDVIWLGAAQIVRVGSFELQIHDPGLVAGGGDNDGSMFIRISDGRSTAVLSGDADSATEETMSASGDWSAQVLKAGHHGSRTASSSAWLRVVHPRWDVVSCGRNNSYGHPHKEAVARMQAAGATVLRTDVDGDISFVATDHGFELRG